MLQQNQIWCAEPKDGKAIVEGIDGSNSRDTSSKTSLVVFEVLN